MRKNLNLNKAVKNFLYFNILMVKRPLKRLLLIQKRFFFNKNIEISLDYFNRLVYNYKQFIITTNLFHTIITVELNVITAHFNNNNIKSIFSLNLFSKEDSLFKWDTATSLYICWFTDSGTHIFIINGIKPIEWFQCFYYLYW